MIPSQTRDKRLSAPARLATQAINGIAMRSPISQKNEMTIYEAKKGDNDNS